MELAWKIEAMSIFGFWINPSSKSMTLEIRTFLQPSFEAEMPEIPKMDEAAVRRVGPPWNRQKLTNLYKKKQVTTD